MLDPAPSAIEFKTVNKNIIRMKQATTVAERIVDSRWASLT